MNSILLGLSLFFAVVPPTLRRRSTPPMHEESCRDHLVRVQISFIHLSDPTGNIARRDPDYATGIRKEAQAMNPDVDGKPNSHFCTKKALNRLDILNALLQFQDAEDSLSQ